MEPSRLIELIQQAIENRTIDHPKKGKMLEYHAGVFKPKFCFVVRDGELKCIWVGNVLKDKKTRERLEFVICEVSGAKVKNGFSYKQWEELAIRIKPHIKDVTGGLFDG